MFLEEMCFLKKFYKIIPVDKFNLIEIFHGLYIKY